MTRHLTHEPFYSRNSMRSKNLLAKSFPGSGKPPSYALLTHHTRDVVDAGETLLEAIGAVSLWNAALPDSMREGIAKTSRLAFWLQDLGKANSHFLEMLEGHPEFAQILRHELISCLIVMNTPLYRWLSEAGYDEATLHQSLWAAGGHHRKLRRDKLKPASSENANVYLDHPDFRAILSELAFRLQLDLKPPHLPPIVSIGTGRGTPCDIVASKAIGDLLDRWVSFAEEVHAPEFYRSVAITKAINIAADVCASAFARTDAAREGRPIAEFVSESLSVGLRPTDLDELMWHYAWGRVETGSVRPDDPDGFPPGFEFRQFQREVAEFDSESAPQSRLTLAVAGCGSGKSLAAYLWARRWCQAWADEGRTNFRLFFTLPTTGTTTEHFKDYVLECGVSPSLKGLSHSRSSVDLNFVAEETAPQEEDGDNTDKAKQASEMIKSQADKIESLDLWATPLVVSTSDTVLGLMGNARRSVYNFPAMMQSAIVFDEIHAYDEELFGHLLMFLETFPKIPVLLMTASLPEARRRAIERVRCDLRIVKGPREHEIRRRYATPVLLDEGDVWDQIRECLKDPRRGKVLWVRNQVEWAVRSYRRCHREFADLDPFVGLYHSRFRYKDRVKVHADVIRYFKSQGRPCILVATQVAEMSLDLSADLLISDLASIAALIQRLGRLNRFATTNDGPSGRAIFCEPPVSDRTGQRDYLPYEEEELKRARLWLQRLMKGEKRLNQRHLSAAFSGFDSGRTVDLKMARQRAVFVSGLWQTYPSSIRGDGYTMPVLIHEDRENFPEAKLGDARFRRDWLREHEVSVPIRAEIRRWEPFGHTPVAPRGAISYGNIDNTTPPAERTGAAWADRR